MTDTGRRVETLTGVPSEQVEKIVAAFRSEGATRVRREAERDGTWTVTAEFAESSQIRQQAQRQQQR